MKARRSLDTKRDIRANLPSILLLVFVFYFIFSCRSIFSPLLLSIEESLGLGHAEAATFFLLLTLSNAVMTIFSGFVSAAIGHRRTIQLAVLLSVASLIAISLSSTLWLIRISLIFLGIGTSLYFPSGIPTLTFLVEDKDEGMGLALHELAPNLGMIVTPIAAVFALRFLSWKGVLFALACLGALAGILFSIFARGGRFYGKPPHLANTRLLLTKPSFWIMATLFALATGAASGVFSMIPTYLVAERGMDRELVNSLVGGSRLSTLVIIFLAGFLVDKLGARRIITVVLAATGLATAALGAAHPTLLITALFLQPLLLACFFPASYLLISHIAPREMYNLTLSFIVFIGWAFGGGLVPYFFGLLGDRFSFSIAFFLYGILMIASAVLPFFLKLETARNEEAEKKSENL